MPRTKQNNRPDGILTSDWHLREDTPICYTGNYQEEQWNSVDFIADRQKQYQCVVYHGGDLFDHWKPSPSLLSKASQHLPDKFISVCGQHDLPQHNLELVHKSGIYNLMINGKVAILQNGHWNQSLSDGRTGFILKGRQFTIQHILTYKGQEPWPGCTAPTAARLLKRYPQFDLILTGDNHKTFVEEYEGRLLVNPGSLMRMDANQIDFKPSVFLWYAETNTIEQVFIPIKEGVISREHIELIKQRDNRINSFVNKLDTDWKAKLTFKENLEIFKNKNSISNSVMQIIYKSLDTQIKK